MQMEFSTETARRIEELLATGRFRDADDLLAHVLDTWQAEQDYTAEMAPLIAEGVKASKDGRTRELLPDLADQIIAAGMERSAARLGHTG
jgi:Arc/MetJ-type ribon-helix-helix transcriptional regulator